MRQDSEEIERRVDWLQTIKNTIDQYPNPVHGIQKDAIQNAVDAIPPEGLNPDESIKKVYLQNKWSFTFQLIKVRTIGGSKHLLIMIDQGTIGLKGKKRANEFKELIPKEERWARFESYAVPNQDESSLGSRGQGKFVFMGASKENKIIYDTYTIDNDYRVGYTYATHSRCPVGFYNNGKGALWLRKEWGLSELRKMGQGTRIIIVDPTSQVIEKLKSGEFLENIEETWWPLIRDYGAKIKIIDGQDYKEARVPSIFRNLGIVSDSDNHEFWLKFNISFKYGRGGGRKFFIKELYIGYDKNGGIPERHRGIAVFRKGMKVQSVIPLFGYDYEDKIYGYAIVDSETEKLLKEVEKPNHYEFRDEGIWRKLRQVIEDQTKQFGSSKLGIGLSSSSDPEAKQQATISKAIQIFNFITKDWRFEPEKVPPVVPPVQPPLPPSDKKIYISIRDFIFPNSTNIPRLNWGDTVKDWWIQIFNKTDNNVSLVLDSGIFSGDREVLSFPEINGNYEIKFESSLTLNNNQKKFKTKILKKDFQNPGKYELKFKIADKHSKRVYHELVHRFWIEQDPPAQGPFDIRDAHFNEFGDPELETREWFLQTEETGKVFYYNLDHPAFKNAEVDDSSSLYLGEIIIMGTIELMLEQISSLDKEEIKSLKLPFDYQKMTGSDPRLSFLEIVKVRDRVKHQILSTYLK